MHLLLLIDGHCLTAAANEAFPSGYVDGSFGIGRDELLCGRGNPPLGLWLDIAHTQKLPSPPWPVRTPPLPLAGSVKGTILQLATCLITTLLSVRGCVCSFQQPQYASD